MIFSSNSNKPSTTSCWVTVVGMTVAVGVMLLVVDVDVEAEGTEVGAIAIGRILAVTLAAAELWDIGVVGRTDVTVVAMGRMLAFLGVSVAITLKLIKQRR